MKCRTVVARSLDAVCEDHDEPGLEYHVVRDVSVVAGHHHHRLFAWDPFADVLLVLPPVHLPGLQGLQAGWPSAQHQLSADPRCQTDISISTFPAIDKPPRSRLVACCLQ